VSTIAQNGRVARQDAPGSKKLCFGEHCRTLLPAKGRLGLCDICRAQHKLAMRRRHHKVWAKIPEVRERLRQSALKSWRKKAGKPGFLKACADKKRLRYRKDPEFRERRLKYQRDWRALSRVEPIPCHGISATGLACKRKSFDGLGCRWHRGRQEKAA
jgi:hypothetical protein